MICFYRLIYSNFLILKMKKLRQTFKIKIYLIENIKIN